MSRLFRLLLIAIVFVALATLPVTNAVAGSLKVDKDVKVEKFKFKPFFVGLNGLLSEQTIAESGPLSVFVRCEVKRSGTRDDRVSVVYTSEKTGWFKEDESGSSSDNPPLAADQEVVGHDHNNDATGQRQYGNLSETSAVHEDGYHLGVEGDTSGLGLNILGFDCIAVGTVSLIKINDDDDDDD